MDKINVSICLVNHNAKALTYDCIDSIYAKTKVPFEIILVDNNSEDKSVLEIKNKHPEIKIINNEKNVGFAAANNQAIRQAVGKYVILLNNDTILKNNALDLMVDYMEKRKNIGILTCKLFEPSGNIQRNCRAFPLSPLDTFFGRASILSRVFPNNPITKHNLSLEWDYNSAKSVEWVSGAAMMIRKAVIDKLGMLDENYYIYWEDTDYCKRVKDNNWEIWFLPTAEILHFTGSGGGKRSLKLKLHVMYEMHHSAYYYFLKNHYRNIFHPMAILTFFGMLYLTALKGLIEIARTRPNLNKGKK